MTEQSSRPSNGDVPAAADATAAEHADSAESAVAEEFATLARALAAQPSVEATLQTVCELAVKVVGADEAAVTTVRRGAFTTVASTGDLPPAVDRIQYAEGEGPCLDSIEEDESGYRTGDLARETRWPRFAPRAANETGVRSMLSHRLYVKEGTIGALNTYSRRVDAFSDSDLALAKVFATHAALALQAAEVEKRADNLQEALRTNRRIGAAVGILMATRHLSEEDAFQLLRRRSMDANERLVTVAEQVVYTGALD